MATIDDVFGLCQQIIANQEKAAKLATGTIEKEPAPPVQYVPQTIYQPPGSPNGTDASGSFFTVSVVATNPEQPMQWAIGRKSFTADVPVKAKVYAPDGTVIEQYEGQITQVGGRFFGLGTFRIEIDCQGFNSGGYVYVNNTV